MTYAPYTNDRRTIEQSWSRRCLAEQIIIEGCFKNAETGVIFDYATRTAFDGDWAANHPHVIFMSDGSVRFATIKKTVAHVVTDEAADGTPISECWPIKNHRQY
tara:strand:- start:7 stop:318 length:312 start_codon:yes stop_codon:yes gene_type:complete